MHPRNLFLIDGAAGTGKSDLVAYVQKKYAPTGYASVVRKFTTRRKRREELEHDVKLDLEFVTAKEFASRTAARSFVYEYGGHKYALREADLDAALEAFDNVFLIVRDLALIRQLIHRYNHVRVIPIYIYSDRNQVVARLKGDGYSAASIRFRLGRQELVWDDYLRHPDIYAEVIINNSVKNDYWRLIDALIRKYNTIPADFLFITPSHGVHLPAALVGFRDAMTAKLALYSYEKNIFIMMKFRDRNKLVSDYIAEQVTKRGFNFVRADQPPWQITDNVYNPVAVLHCCKYGIALFDEPETGNTFSPNVAYELGMMHLQEKHCLILRHQSLPAMPFDLIKDLHRRYAQDLELRAHITSWLDTLSNQGS